MAGGPGESLRSMTRASRRTTSPESVRMIFRFFLSKSLDLKFCAVAFTAYLHLVEKYPVRTEILFALGEGERVVGTTHFSNYPKEAKKIPRIGSYVAVDIEKIFALHPTLVVAQEYQLSSLNDLKKLHLQVLQIDLHSINSIEHSILRLGERLGRKKRAKELVETIERARKEAKKSKRRKRVLVVFGLHESFSKGVYVSGNTLFYDEILHICGDVNAFSDPAIAQPVLNLEQIIALNPDAILILHSPKSEPNVNKRKALRKWFSLPINAAKSGDIHIIEDDYAFIPSHRIALTIQRFCKAL